ncbi:hypothetical protein [Methylobacterium indicum]|uniref:Uncharacterized protein n=1 Tax=Methylobacterium indicum TaxID=1775910 RepID=A0A8H8X0D2_9HYPH|nr:hypothetical protein [Methylobacterium indicum]BCM87896.1 hypothetical protein mvi_63570 [Methylobacterium indicum]
MGDAFLMFERFHWTMEAVEQMDWSDFIDIADGVKLMYKREEDARRAAQRQ